MNLGNGKQRFILNSENKFKFVLLFLIVIVVFAHLYELGIVPRGLFLDEVSIGYNAATIAQNGVDEYGNHFPVFFRAFGEYKNPVYIYTAAIIFKFFGSSDFSLRFTSFLFFILGLVFSFFLVVKIFAKNRIVQVYLILAFGFLPHFFTLSRISFEVISQLTFVSAAVLLVWIVFNGQATKNSRYYVIGCGLLFGLSVYTYTTARLLSFLMLGILWIVYIKRENFKKLVVLTLSFSVTLIPLLLFVIKKPDALTGRFDKITYIYYDISLTDKISAFFSKMASYWSLDFLIKNGDANLRHSIGYGGIVFVVSLLLFLVGIVAILTNKKLILNRFNLFLLANLLIAPLAGALTANENPHALRGLLLGYFILMISCFGINFITEIVHKRLRWILIIGLITSLVVEIVFYLGNYFIFYPTRSIQAFETYGLEESLQMAIDQNPKEIVYFDSPDSLSYSALKFYSYVLRNPQAIPFQMNVHFDPLPGSCYIFRQNDLEGKNSPYPYDKLEIKYKISPLEKYFNVPQPTPLFETRCYKKIQ